MYYKQNIYINKYVFIKVNYVAIYAGVDPQGGD